MAAVNLGRIDKTKYTNMKLQLRRNESAQKINK